MTTVHWRKHGIHGGRLAVHQAVQAGDIFVSACGVAVPAEYMEEPTGWAWWATALHGTPLPPDMKWRVEDEVTCKRCLKKLEKS